MFLFQNSQNTISVSGLDNRTTSLLESLHSSANRSMPNHPHFFAFIEGMKQLEFSKSSDLVNSFNGNYVKGPRKRKEYQERNAKIDELSQKFNAKKITISEFLEGVAQVSCKRNR